MAERKFRFLDPESPRRAPDYGSRKMQSKLFALVACLFAVLWCMQQAAQPETWQWLVVLDQKAQARRADEQAKSAAAKTDPAGEAEAEATSLTKPSLGDPTPPALTTGNYDPAVPPANLPWILEAVYWRLALARLTPEEQFNWVQAVQVWSTELDVDPQPDPVLSSAVVKLSNLRQQFDRQIMSLATSAPAGGVDWPAEAGSRLSPTQQADPPEALAAAAGQAAEAGELPDLPSGPRVAQIFSLPPTIQLTEAQAVTDHSRWLATVWERVRGPSGGVEPRQDVSLAQALACRDHWRKLRDEFLEPVLWGSVTDGSRLGRPAERAAWLRLLQKAQDTAERASQFADTLPQRVTRQNLMGQPTTFRGQRVRITGTVRRVEIVPQQDPVVARYVPGPNYAVLWLQPGVSGQGPYCVYTVERPELTAMADGSGDLRRPATLDGWFFKLHPYLAANGQPATCPLLFAPGVELRAVSPVAAPTALSLGEWGLALTAVGLTAVGLALAVWYSTRYRSANPLGAQKRQQAQVQWLQTAGVTAPGEALREFAQRTTGPEAGAVDVEAPTPTERPDPNSLPGGLS
jgi:hypothetical protein